MKIFKPKNEPWKQRVKQNQNNCFLSWQVTLSWLWATDMTSSMGYTQCQTYCILLTKMGGLCRHTDTGSQALELASACRQTGQSTLELHNSGRCPASSLGPAGEFTFVNCFLQGLAQDSLPAGAGLCLPTSLSPAAHLVLPQLALWAVLPSPLHHPSLSVSLGSKKK